MTDKIDKSKFKDEKNRYIVQGLFLEDRYDADMSVFTFDGEDKIYKGKKYLSLKKLYLEHGDPMEYSFARKYLYDWNHWQRLRKNVIVGKHIDDWKRELELSLVSEGVSALIDLALNEKSYQAAKYLADKGWDKSERGRPSKEEVEGELKRRADSDAEFNEDFKLLSMHKGK
jgi:hypothetical protein